LETNYADSKGMPKMLNRFESNIFYKGYILRQLYSMPIFTQLGSTGFWIEKVTNSLLLLVLRTAADMSHTQFYYLVLFVRFHKSSILRSIHVNVLYLLIAFLESSLRYCVLDHLYWLLQLDLYTYKSSTGLFALFSWNIINWLSQTYLYMIYTNKLSISRLSRCNKKWLNSNMNGIKEENKGINV